MPAFLNIVHANEDTCYLHLEENNLFEGVKAIVIDQAILYSWVTKLRAPVLCRHLGQR